MDAHWQGEPGFGTTTGKEDSPTRKISQIVLKCIAQCCCSCGGWWRRLGFVHIKILGKSKNI